MRPLTVLFALFALVPLAELYLLLRVGGALGAAPTLGLVLLTAALGSWLVRREGLATVQRLRAQLAAGQPPAEPMLEAACLLIAGALLLTPGFLTDAAGFALLVPPLRRALIRRHLPPQFAGAPPTPPTSGGRTIEGEFTRRD